MSDEANEPQIVESNYVEDAGLPSEAAAPETVENEVGTDQVAATGEPTTPDAAPPDGEADADKSNQAWARLRRERKEAQDRALEAVKEAAYLKGRLEASHTPEPVQTAPMAPEDILFEVPRPSEDDFETFDDYEVAKEDWLVAKAEHRAMTKLVRQEAQRQTSASTGSWLQEAPADLPDFLAKVTLPVDQGGAPLSSEMVEICRASKVGHQLLYQLASDPQEVARLRALPPHLMGMELSRREEKLRITPAQAKRISDAPAPIRPLTPAAASLNKPLEELPIDEFMRERNRQQFGPDWKGR
jgi:hypothetical protein